MARKREKRIEEKKRREGLGNKFVEIILVRGVGGGVMGKGWWWVMEAMRSLWRGEKIAVSPNS